VLDGGSVWARRATARFSACTNICRCACNVTLAFLFHCTDYLALFEPVTFTLLAHWLGWRH